MGSTVLSRRAAVRGAVWSIPAVTVATTAPAFANTSGALAVTGLVVTYLTDQPEKVSVTATVTGFTDSYQMSLTLPPGVFDSVSDAASGSASTGLADSHTLVLTSATADFHATLDLGSRTALPWRGFQGPAFTVSAVARADGRESATTTTAVEAYAMPDKVLNTDASPTASLARVFSDSIAAHQEHPGVVGKIVVVVAIPQIAGKAKPTIAGQHQSWSGGAVADADGEWLYRFVTHQSHHTSRTGLGANPDRGPAPDGGNHYEFWAQLSGMPAELVGRYAGFFYSLDGDTKSRFNRSAQITA
ncbi:hypothetical protein [Nocardioides pinisoli]|uniref:Uncharacterized protein n=1 Tax=Nocardioides pinisoli TaxID=2950279 RepID=A0ABT1KU64_9ACTN|nr:hypothetical protein [Nocardioides pinisoli]MCP3420909.1 hypothetical protein [Nocardioides pinisoli]